MVMKKFTRLIDIILYLVTITMLVSAVGSLIAKKPMLLSAVRSNSMFPLFQRGDMIFIRQITGKTKVKVGDIIVFKAEEGSLKPKGWIVHRIVGGNPQQGYITKGDANERTDQESVGGVKIKPDWMAARVVTVGKIAIKLPLIGHLTLFMERYQKNPLFFPAFGAVLMITIIANTPSGKNKSKNKVPMQLICIFGGLTISIILAISMLTASQHFTIVYEVSENNKGIISGSDVGILKIGDVIERPLVEPCNKTLLPVITTITSSDPQISVSDKSFALKLGESKNISIKLEAIRQGKYKAYIHVGKFLPLIPHNLVYWLARKSYWLALIVISIIPATPIIIYPLIDSRMRRKTIKEIRHCFRRIRKALTL